MTLQELIDRLIQLEAQGTDSEADVKIWNWNPDHQAALEANVSETGGVWLEPGD